ncbi:phage tail tube protein [Kribbella deserti]|uniref:Phage tail protein n=1 Tax=Kribbella deserti TaxID=1926257 RepID=A0ABV6QF28_9ACTN
MVAVFPPGIKAEGASTVVFVPTLADPADVVLAEVTGGLDVSYFLKGGQFQPGGDQPKGDDRRYGSKETFEVLGRDKPSIADIQYVIDPQAAAATPENEAYETFKAGVTGFFIIRWGLDVDAAFAAAQVVDVWPVMFGAQRKTPIAENDEFAVLTATQSVAVTGRVEYDVPIAAA